MTSLETNTVKSPEKKKIPNFAARKAVAVGSIALAAISGWVANDLAREHLPQPPEYSGTKVYTFESNDGMDNAAQSVEGYNKVNIVELEDHIENMPENADVDFDDLHPGLSITTPDHIE